MRGKHENIESSDTFGETWATYSDLSLLTFEDAPMTVEQIGFLPYRFLDHVGVII